MELFVSFSEIARYFRRNRPKFILVILAAGIVCGLLPLKFAQHTYSGNTTLTFTCPVPENAESDYQLQYTNVLYSRVQAAVALAEENKLLTETARRSGVDEADISKITAEQLNSSPVVKVTVYTSNAGKAALLSDTAAQLLADDMEKQFPSPKLTARISDPSVPAKPQSKKSAMVKSGILGLLLGFVLSLCYGIIRVLSDHTVRNSRFAEEALKTSLLAEIPAGNSGDAFRRMRSAALHQAPDAGIFLVTGVCSGDGGDAVAAGFAASLAQTGKTVLAVDADLHDPQLASRAGLAADKTLADVLGGSCPLEQAAAAVPSQPGLSVLAGSPVKDASPADLFAGEKFRKLLADAAGRYDYVVLCAPADADYPDAENLAGSSQAVILTIRYGSTPFQSMKEACRRIAVAGGRLAGFVTTDA